MANPEDMSKFWEEFSEHSDRLKSNLETGLLNITRILLRQNLIGELREELDRQDRAWGVDQHHPVHTTDTEEGWDSILWTAFDNAVSDQDPELRRQKLITLAAVAIAWIEQVDE